jgi:hypothetical protein
VSLVCPCGTLLGCGRTRVGALLAFSAPERVAGYVEARKMIYAPLYAEAVLKTDAYERRVLLWFVSETRKPYITLDFVNC